MKNPLLALAAVTSSLFGFGRGFQSAPYDEPPFNREVPRPKVEPPIRLKLDNRPLKMRSRRAAQNCHRINLARA